MKNRLASSNAVPEYVHSQHCQGNRVLKYRKKERGMMITKESFAYLNKPFFLRRIIATEVAIMNNGKTKAFVNSGITS